MDRFGSGGSSGPDAVAAAQERERVDTVLESKLKTIINIFRETKSKDIEQKSISRVPDQLRSGNEVYLQPTKISIGLLHAKDTKLAMATKEFKRKMLFHFLLTMKINEDELIRVLSYHAKSLTSFYNDSPYDLEKDPRNQEVLEALLLDSCCIVGLVLMYDWKFAWRAQNTEIQVLTKDIEVLMFAFRQDFLKFENQIPYRVLADVAKLAMPSMRGPQFEQDLAKRVLAFFQMSMAQGNSILKSALDGEGVHHLLQLVLLNLFPHLPQQHKTKDYDVDTETIISNSRSASELVRHGIKLKRKTDASNLADIVFKDGVLYIPRLDIDRNTAALMWNFLVFEMCRESPNSCFMSYVFLMNLLICSREDVDALLQAGIFRIWFNDKDAVVSIFDSLCNCFTPLSFHYKNLVYRLNKYCDAALRPQRAEIARKYYADRWNMLNSILLFVFTVTQTVFSVLGYNPKEGIGK